jgi:hypothetical protein|tara:strand:+ start:4153 stop:5682 length:1530 start_codon:yes stop_codon:yes gene_type:complete
MVLKMNGKKDKILFWIETYQIHFGIAKALIEKYDCEPYALIVSSPKQKPFFDNQELIKFKKSWYLRDNVDLINHKPDIEKLKLFENKFSISLRKIIYGDRFFYKYNKYHKFTDEKIFSILQQELEFYIQILDEIKPDYVLIRNPEFQDIQLFYEICKSKKIQVLILSYTRFSDKWMLSSKADDPIPLDNLDKNLEIKSFDDLIDSSKHLAFNTSLWLPKQKSTISQKFSVLKLIFSTFHQSNINNYRDIGKTPWTTLTKRMKLLLNSFFRERFLNKNTIKLPPLDKPYAFFPLQMEPEERILIKSQFFVDQLSVIKNISQSLPVEIDLLVKEHPSMKAMGWRDLDFYKKILEMPNVKLIHPSVSTDSLIQNSSIIITIAGTTAFEAAFYEKPSIVFTNVIFSTLSCVFVVKILEELPDTIKKCLSSKVELIELNHYVDKIKKSSFSADLINLNTLASQLFGMGGFIDNNVISESIMEKFLKEHKNEFNKLADEHIKKIKLIKQNKNNEV